MNCKFFLGTTAIAEGNMIVNCEKGDFEMSKEQCDNVTSRFCNDESNCRNCNYFHSEMKMLVAQEDEAISEDFRTAIVMHQHICECYRTAATAIVEMGKSLKEIRDKKLFVKLGYETFAEYLENNGDYTFKERQAYTYIKLYEDNSTKFLEQNASLGVTKLELLSKIPGYEREEFVEKNDLAGMTVEQIKKLIKEHQQMGEQLSLFEAEMETIKENSQDELNSTKDALNKALAEIKELKKNNSDVKTHFFDKENELKSANKEIEKLQSELDDMKAKPVDVAVREPDESEIAKIKKELQDEIQTQYNKEIEKLKENQQKQIDAVKSEYADKIKSFESDKQALENKLKSGNADEAKIALKLIFEDVQKNINEFIEKIKVIEDETVQNKYFNGVKVWLSTIINDLGGL